MEIPSAYVTMSEVRQLNEKILSKIVLNNIKYDIVLDVWRGGTMTHILMSHLDKYKHMQRTGVLGDLPVFHSYAAPVGSGPDRQIRYVLPTEVSCLESDNILIIEDLLDTGETIQNIYNNIRAQSRLCNIDIACLYIKGWKQHAQLLNDRRVSFIYGEIRSQKEWISFPWEPGGEIEKNNILINKKTIPYEAVKGTIFDPNNIPLKEYKEPVNNEGITEEKKTQLKQQISKKWK